MVDWFTPGFRAGGPIRSCANLVDWMSAEMDFSVITSDRDWGTSEGYAGIESDKWIKMEDGTKIFYASPGWLSFSNLKKIINSESYDYVLLNSMYSLPFTIWPLRIFKKNKTRPKILLAPRGMLRPGALAIKKFKKKIFLFGFKLFRLQKNITFISTGEHETEDIQRVFGTMAKINYAPNLPSKSISIWKPVPKKAGTADFISISRIAQIKNNEMSIRVFRKLKGNALLKIFGPLNEPEYWEKCKEELNALPPNVAATYNGELNPSLVPATLAEFHFFILPSWSENFGHAIFEALSNGKPVIIGDQTPWRNLAASHSGWDLPLNNEDGFTAILEKAIAMDQDEYNAWSKGAWDLANQFSSNSNIAELYRKVFS